MRISVVDKGSTAISQTLALTLFLPEKDKLQLRSLAILVSIGMRLANHIEASYKDDDLPSRMSPVT